MQDRFVARTIGDLRGVGDILQLGVGGGELGETEREVLEHATGTLVEGNIEWGGAFPRTKVGVLDLQLGTQAKPWEWEQAVMRVAGDRRVVFTDGSKEEGCSGMVGGGWFENESRKGTMTVGQKATVWHGEIAGLEGALRMVGNSPVLLLTDSRAAIQAVQKAGKRGVARTRGLVEVVRRLAAIDEEHGGGSAILGWVKAHVGISGNERADEQAKLATEGRDGTAVTEGGIRAECKERRRQERVVRGFGSGRVVRWSSRYAITAFSQLQTNKGLLASWLKIVSGARAASFRLLLVHLIEG